VTRPAPATHTVAAWRVPPGWSIGREDLRDEWERAWSWPDELLLRGRDAIEYARARGMSPECLLVPDPGDADGWRGAVSLHEAHAAHERVPTWPKLISRMPPEDDGDLAVLALERASVLKSEGRGAPGSADLAALREHLGQRRPLAGDVAAFRTLLRDALRDEAAFRARFASALAASDRTPASRTGDPA
jgi:hypothetical protein